MTAKGGFRSRFYVGVLTALTVPLGAYMARVYEGERILLDPRPRPARAARLPGARRRAQGEQDWKAYAKTLLVFSLLSWVVLYLILRTQGIRSRSTRRASARRRGT